MKSNLPKLAEKLGFYAICLMAISMPISRAAFNIGAFTLLISWIASGRYRSLPNDIAQSLALRTSLLLFAWIAVSALYSSAPSDMAWSHVARYHKLLLLPAIISFLPSTELAKKYLSAITIGLLFLLIAYIADIYIDIPGTHSAKTNSIGVFNNYIIEGLSLATLALIMLMYAADFWHSKRSTALVAISVFCTLIVIVLFVNPGRGAQLALISGLLVFSYLLIPNRVRVYGMIAIIVCITFTALQSNLLISRFEKAVSELQASAPDKSSSIGSRIHAWKNGLALWQEKPILGHGAGSYKHLMFTEKSHVVRGCTDNPVCLQPHNQFVLFLVEQGLIGCMLFVILLYSLAAPVRKYASLTAKLSAAFALTFAVHSFFDSGLVMGNHMVIFITLASAMIAFDKIRSNEERKSPDRFKESPNKSATAGTQTSVKES